MLRHTASIPLTRHVLAGALGLFVADDGACSRCVLLPLREFGGTGADDRFPPFEKATRG